jgi:hypothetical protein
MRIPMKGLKYLIIAAIAIFAAWYAYSPYQTVHAMKSAGESRNGEDLAEHIDFPSVRASIKEQINARLLKVVKEESEENPVKALGAAFGGMLVDKLVDAYVTPAGLIEMMEGDRPEDVVADDIAPIDGISRASHHDDADGALIDRVALNGVVVRPAVIVPGRDGIGPRA